MGTGAIPPDVPGFSVPFTKDEITLNGGSDFSSIQAAIDNAVDGDVVTIGPGTFNETVDVNVQNLTVVGSGRGTLIDGQSQGSPAVTVSATGVTVKNLAARTDTGQTGNVNTIEVDPGSVTDDSNIQLINLWVLQSDNRGILLRRANDAILEGITVEDSGTGAVRLSNADRGKIRGLNVLSSNSRGLTVIDDCSRWQLLGVGVQGVGSKGIVISGTECLLIGSHVIDSGSNALEVNGTGSGGLRNVIIGGTYRNPTTGSNEIVLNEAKDTQLYGVVYQDLTDGGQGGRNTINGKWIGDLISVSVSGSIPTIDLGGSDQEATPTINFPAETYTFFIDAGGSATTLQGLNPQNNDGTSVADDIGARIRLIHTGGETVTLEHNNGTASHPLKNTSLGNEDLDANDEMVEYVYDGNAWRQMGSNIA